MKKAIIFFFLMVAIATAEEKVVIIGGWNSTDEQMAFLKGEMPDSEVVILQKFVPLEDAAIAFLEQLKEKGLSNNELTVIAYSWGGLIIRRISEDYPEIKIKKIILVGTPNGGYSIAPRWFWRMFYGKMPDRKRKSKYPLFVIAGDKGRERWFLKGSNDGAVELSSVLAVEAKEVRIFPLSHVQLVRDKSVVEQIQLWKEEKYEKEDINNQWLAARSQR